MEPKISVIVPVYKAEEYLPRCVDSILSQSFTDFELILVDDCSTDETLKTVQDFLSQLPGEKQSQIRVIALPENVGAANTRNAGTKTAKGRYLCFLDADDLWLPTKLERQLAFMSEKDVAFSFMNYEFGDADAVGTGKVVHVPAEIRYKQALQNTTIFTSTVMFDTKKVGLDNLLMPSIKSEDSALWFKLLRGGMVAYGIQETLIIYRRPANSLSSNKVEAIRRIWNVYRRSEGLGVVYSFYNLCFWALRAVMRRI